MDYKYIRAILAGRPLHVDYSIIQYNIN